MAESMRQIIERYRDGALANAARYPDGSKEQQMFLRIAEQHEAALVKEVRRG